MSRQSSSERNTAQVLARNPKARHDYHILETWECGLVLTGSEIKSIRAGKASLKEAYGTVRNGEVWLEGMHVAPYESGGYANHPPVRPRKLLLHRREIRRMIGSVEQRGLTLVPLDIHVVRGRAKVTLALGRGKKLHDRRDELRRRAAERELARALSRRQ
ncbi:MAG TPA: SsrA-binding protein SmpB [Gemmatimonadales bacterium]|nr:SsrA-binding protein SmpB [Gemmatimonadales bacterium]